MNKKLLMLLFLLALTVLIGLIVLQEEEKEVNASDPSNNLFILAVSEPFITENRVLGTKIDKTPETPKKAHITRDDCPYYSIVSQYDWNTSNACSIMLCESSGNSSAHNLNHRTRDSSWGLFQINLYGRLANERPSAEWLLVPENNISYAYEIFLKEGRRFGTTGGWKNCARLNNIH